MENSYAAGVPPPHTGATSPTPQWQQPSANGEIRSVTPAMNNTRGGAANRQYPSRVPSPYAQRQLSPQRYAAYGASPVSQNTAMAEQLQQPTSGPSSSGLIRLTLRKPMGIVFEPMYDPNQPSVQRGVRICDLPRTGAAALSRKLEIGDELLSINDKTMSRLTFDEIMDFIIEADPEQVNLLFRRPRRELLAARNSQVKAPSTAAVKWVDEDKKKESKPQAKKEKTSTSSRKKKKAVISNKSDDDTLETYEDPSKRKKSSRMKRDPYENESFLDLLIDTICANPDNVCKHRRDDEYDSDAETLTSHDDSTYFTYESEKEPREKVTSKNRVSDSEDDTLTVEEQEDRRRSSKNNDKKKPPAKYEDDQTLETIETEDRTKAAPSPVPITPLGLIPEEMKKPEPPEPPPPQQQQQRPQSPPPPQQQQPMPVPEEETNKAPITELEYDEYVDADVSVMESLGGPSLLIEKQRNAIALAKTNEDVVPREIISEFGDDYPAEYGLSREQTIFKDPIKFYTFVVKNLLEQHEPEKVRLLDKLLAKYKGREDHLVQKLSVRYKRGDGDAEFTDAVNKIKDSENTDRVVQKAVAAAAFSGWPEKETKEPEDDDGGNHSDEESDFEEDDSIDGTSPAVIAQVSELLNYVYGKTSVPGQIDRVSTIMRAYEGREAVLLELLETKALIKANSEKENVANLPSFLRNSPALKDTSNTMDSNANNNEAPSSPMINDDISSMSGVSSPAQGVERSIEDPPALTKPSVQVEKKNQTPTYNSSNARTTPTTQSTPKPQATPTKASTPEKQESVPATKKKKGFLGGLFKKGGKRIRNKTKDEGSI